MLLELKSVFLNEGTQKQVSYNLSMQEIEIDGFYPFKTPVEMIATAQNRAGLVSLVINANFTFTLPCARCFEETETCFKYAFTHKLVVSLEGDSDDDYIETPDYTLELDQLVKADILLELPSRILCKTDCKGLCPKCGYNLNTGNCGCDTKTVDPRLEILKQLID